MNVADNLKSVRENADLTFPSNVTLHFVFWSHSSKNLPLINDALQTADCIADEMASMRGGVSNEPPRAKAKHYEKTANRVIQGTTNKEDSTYLAQFDDLSAALPSTLAELPKKPRLFLVDDFEGETDCFEVNERLQSENVPLGESFVEAWHDMVEVSMDREVIVIRQLASIAERMAKNNNEPQELAVLYGAAHTSLSVAAKRLGAQVSRTFIHFPTRSIAENIARLNAYGVVPSFHEMPKEDQGTILASLELDWAMSVGSGLRRQGGSIGSRMDVLRKAAVLNKVDLTKLESKARKINKRTVEIRNQWDSSKGRLKKTWLAAKMSRTSLRGSRLEKEFKRISTK